MSFEKQSSFAKRILGGVLYHSGLFNLFCTVYRKREIAILTYHKTRHQTDDPVELNVRPEILEKQIAALMGHTEFISLDQAVEKIRSRQIDGHYTVLTFDDGYRATINMLYPVLTKYDVPCTFFLNVGAMETGRFYGNHQRSCHEREKHSSYAGQQAQGQGA
jgi:peptidoglycan/xylan/chitin deacetylase (PgdA/CDA1 family)